MATTNDDLRALAADNTEAGVSFYQDDGRRIFKDRAEMETAAFAKPSQQLKASAPAQDPQMLSQVAASSAKGADFVANLDRRYEELNAIAATNPQEYFKNFASLQQEVAAKNTDFMKEAQATAYSRYQVAEMDAALKQSIQMDDLAPGYRQRSGMADSDETAKVRTQLLQAKASADGAIPELLKQNQAYMGMNAKNQILSKGSEHVFMRATDQNQRLDIVAEQQLAPLSSEQRESLALMSGKDVTDTRGLAAAMNFGKDAESIKQAVLAKPEDLPFLALAGNSRAKDLWIKKEPTGDAKLQIVELESISRDPATADKAYKEMASSGFFVGRDRAVEDNRHSAMLMAAKSTDKNMQKESALYRINLAGQYGQFKTQKKFTEDLGTLPSSSIGFPSFLEHLRNDPTKGTGTSKVTLEMAKDEVAKAPTVDEKQKRKAELLTFYKAAVEAQNKSLLFKIEPMSVKQLENELNLKVAGVDGIFARMNKAVVGDRAAKQVEGDRRIKEMQDSLKNVLEPANTFLWGIK